MANVDALRAFDVFKAMSKRYVLAWTAIYLYKHFMGMGMMIL